MLIRFGILIVASIAVYAAKQITVNYFKPKSPLSKPSGTAEESFKYQKDVDRMKNKLTGSTYSSGEEEGEVEDDEEEGVFILNDSIKYNLKPEINIESGDGEVEYLRSLVTDMEKRREKLEMKLFVYGLQQQEMDIIELKNDLEMKTMDTNRLSAAMKALQVENKKLQVEIQQCVLAKHELERSKMKIKELQKKIKIDSHNGRPIMMLGEQVANFRTDESHENDKGIQAKLNTGKKLEMEALELKRKQKELQLEKRVLCIKLVVAEARVTAFSDTTESEVIRSLKAEANASRLVNKDLLNQVEELQQNRFDVVEEVVYQRWINACLRHEIQTYQISQESSTSNIESVSSPQSSTERENKLYTSLEEDSSDGKAPIRQKTSLIHKLKRWRNSLDSSSVGSSLWKSLRSSSKSTASSESSMSRRSSFSGGSYGASTLKNLRKRVAVPTVETDITNSPKFRKRRVSFNDSLNTVIPLKEKSTTSSPNTQSVNRMRRRVSLSDLLRSTSVVHDKYPNYGRRRQIVFGLQKPIKENEVRTEVFAECYETEGMTSEMGESIPSSLVRTSTEENTDETLMTRQIESKAKPADHIEETAPVIPKSPDINITDAISTLFLLLVFLYLFLRYVVL